MQNQIIEIITRSTRYTICSKNVLPNPSHDHSVAAHWQQMQHPLPQKSQIALNCPVQLQEIFQYTSLLHIVVHKLLEQVHLPCHQPTKSRGIPEPTNNPQEDHLWVAKSRQTEQDTDAHKQTNKIPIVEVTWESSTSTTCCIHCSQKRGPVDPACSEWHSRTRRHKWSAIWSIQENIRVAENLWNGHFTYHWLLQLYQTRVASLLTTQTCSKQQKPQIRIWWDTMLLNDMMNV